MPHHVEIPCKPNVFKRFFDNTLRLVISGAKNKIRYPSLFVIVNRKMNMEDALDGALRSVKSQKVNHITVVLLGFLFGVLSV